MEEISLEVRRYLEKELRDYKENLRLLIELRQDIIEEGTKIDLGVPPNQNKGKECQTVKVHKLMTNKQICRLEKMCNAIAKILEKLDDVQHNFYERYFVNRQLKVKICMEMPLSEATFYRYKKKIIYSLAEELGYV